MSPSPKNRKEPILLVDGHSLAYRAFYALPADLRTSSGQVTNAVYGFTSMLIKAMQDYKTEHIAVAFDLGAPSERLAIRPEYKAQRTTAPDEFKQQVGLIHEVLDALKVPMFQIPNVEADDIIHILATRFASEGREVIVVTADRDFFQMVQPRISLMMNKRGISETVVYDTAATEARFGFGPERYLDYAALRGDPSDNIEGVPGVGEKTAAKLIHSHGDLETIFDHLDELTPKLRQSLEEARERLLQNREFFRLRGMDDLASHGVDVSVLDVGADDVRMGEWDFVHIRKLFDSLEFKTLYDRLAAGRPEASEAIEGFSATAVQITTASQLEELAARLGDVDPLPIRLIGDAARPRAAPATTAFALGDESFVVAVGPGMTSEKVWKVLGERIEGHAIVTHDSKEAMQRLKAVGVSNVDIVMDTLIAAYLIDPARGSYGLDELSRHYLDRDLKLAAEAKGDASGQASLLDEPETDHSSKALEAVAIKELAPILAQELRDRGAWELFTTLELPLARVLATVEARGIRLDISYLKAMSTKISGELVSLEKQIYDLAGEPFNIGSPPQLRNVLYEKLGLKPSKKTKTGYSTDAGVLESLREEHPIIDLILRHRERAKLKSTYLDALPPLVDPQTGRLHCRFNQTVATTGRLSSDSPNLQNIPIRTDEGKQIRRAFIPEEGHLLLVADYSQIELRILAHLSKDPALLAAFDRGDDIHSLSIAKALDIDASDVTPELRSIGKMVSYGVTYGMGAFGLSQRLRIPVDQARTYIEGFFAMYPRVREYLDEVVAQATADGFTTTMLGRRRYVPELQSKNPRVRSLGERQALNAPIQGSAADILKLAMVTAEASLEATTGKMLLTVHDELVFEVPEGDIEPVASEVRRAMEGAVQLDVPLDVDLGWGDSWASAKA